MEMLMSAIIAWISVSLNLPHTTELPQMQRLSPEGMAAFRGGSGEVQALYDDAAKVIYLDENWTGTNAGEVSVLVHELVHHVQNIAGLRYECAQARERPAYLAQERWLRLWGRSLEADFDIDPLTMLVRTRCMHP